MVGLHEARTLRNVLELTHKNYIVTLLEEPSVHEKSRFGNRSWSSNKLKYVKVSIIGIVRYAIHYNFMYMSSQSAHTLCGRKLEGSGGEEQDHRREGQGEQASGM